MSIFFALWPHNRLEVPTKHVLICEDDIEQQALLCSFFARTFGGQRKVQITVAPGAVYAFVLLQSFSFDLVLLDHDMPHGNGKELLERLAEAGVKTPPVIAISGIPQNNERLQRAGAGYAFRKHEIYGGEAVGLIRELLNLGGEA